MTQGETVMIYQDPMTRKEPEGEAELVELHSKDLPYSETWWVQFVDDGNRLVLRRIVIVLSKEVSSEDRGRPPCLLEGVNE